MGYVDVVKPLIDAAVLVFRHGEVSLALLIRFGRYWHAVKVLFGSRTRATSGPRVEVSGRVRFVPSTDPETRIC